MTVLLDKLQKQFKNKKVLIVGLGLQAGGVGLTRFFSKLGARVKVTDLRQETDLSKSINQLKSAAVEFILGEHRLEDFLEADYIFKGPSVPWTLPQLIAAKEKGIPIEMEASFFASLSPAPIVGITGTRGKSTTTTMIYEILKNLRGNVLLGGNVSGVSTIEILERVKEGDLVIMELSSWALSGFHQKKISPHIAVFTNLYTDHLNYYPSVKEYFYDKKAIYIYQNKSDFFIANKRLKNEIKHDNPRSKILYFQKEDFHSQLKNLKGDHNLENAAAAFTLTKVLHLDQEKAEKIIAEFKGLPYRQEIVGAIQNTIFINDTTSTTPVAASYAIDTFSDSQIVLILGGNAKNLPYGDLFSRLAKIKSIVLVRGSFTDQILPNLKKQFPEKITQVFENLDDAVKKAYEIAKELNGKVYVLFSPAATSFSMFKNEFDRGDEFNKSVKKIITGEKK